MNAGFAGTREHGAVAIERSAGRDGPSIDELLEELTELRELDRQRHTHAPGSQDHQAVTTELELRTRRLMDRFRDLKFGSPIALPALAPM